ncbi:FAD-binding oxidoreductase [Gammaproteobacteria bacterium]|nr:FAD-binding oxidoreductase [Gammaproteobacteria bacterium]
MADNPSIDSVWKLTAPAAGTYPRLEGKARAEVVVVGGGFCGLSAALHLAEAGRTVALIDSHEPGWGASGRNGGQVIPGLKLDPAQLVKRLGAGTGEALANLAGGAPDLVFDIVDRYSLHCNPQRTGWIQLAAGPSGLRQIDERVRQWRSRGVDIDSLDQSQIHSLTGARGYVGGLIDRRGGNLNPLAYARGLAVAVTTHNARIYSHSEVVSMKQIKSKWVVETGHGQLTSTRLLLCTNAYSDAIWPGLAKTIIPFISGAVATEPLSYTLRESILGGGQAVADNCRLLSWFGLDPEGRLIFGGRTGTWKETNNQSDYRNRIRRMHVVFPQVKDVPVKYYWSGKVALTPDSLPHIHKLAANLYAGLGFNGRGVAMATLMGKLLAQQFSEEGGDAILAPSPMKPIPFHFMRKPVVQSAVAWKKVLDRVNP